MDRDYIVYRCKTCGRHFSLFSEEVEYTEEESTYITCPYHGKHKNIIVVGAYDDLKDCLNTKKDTYKRIGNRIHQTGWKR